MKMDKQLCREVLLIRLEGELDLASAPDFRRLVDESMGLDRPQMVVVDLRGVSFVDSSGLGAILGRYRRLKSEGIEMILVASSHKIREVLELSGIDRAISVVDSPEDISALSRRKERGHE